jgi:hypothetical protein
MTPLEKLAIDYVRARDAEETAKHKLIAPDKTGKAFTAYQDYNDAMKASEQVLAAMRSHVQQAYADELKEFK